jgi:hypothetical protein
MMFSIEGSQYKSAGSVNRAVLYTASDCHGCFDRQKMYYEIAALQVGESITYPKLHFLYGPANPGDIVITRTA